MTMPKKLIIHFRPLDMPARVEEKETATGLCGRSANYWIRPSQLGTTHQIERHERLCKLCLNSKAYPMYLLADLDREE